MDWASLYSPGAILSVIGIAVGVLYGRRSSKRQKFSYSLDSATLMDKKENESFQEIDIRFQDKNIDKLTVTKLTIWNSGNKAIRKSDIAHADLLRLSLGKADILNCRIIKKTDERGQFKAEQSNDGEVFLNFDYFDPNDGFKCEIIHTGEEKDIKLCGKIIGTKKSLYLETAYSKKSYESSFIAGILSIVIGFFVGFPYLCKWWFPVACKIVPAEYSSMQGLVVIIFFSALYIFLALVNIVNGIFILYRAAGKSMPAALQ